jgi:crotonobetainyl-CoA:carnitine CoA-transferase CaiB-like acyl-CoA transferase
MGWIAPDDVDSLFWKLINRGKRSIVLDLKQPVDLTVARSLIRQADVLIENMRPGKLERLGLDPSELHAENPRLVVVRVSGFGQSGPYAQRPGFATIAEAMSGLSGITGEADRGPLLPPIALTDEVTALAAAFTALVALRHAEHTGHGQVVDINLLESMLQIMGPLPAAWQKLGYLQPRLGAGIPYSIPRGTYQCSDGTWVALSASAESVAQRVLALLGVDEDPRFTDFTARFAHREELERITTTWVARRTSVEVLEVFAAVDAAVAPVLSMAEVVADPHVQARQALVDVDGTLMQQVVARLSLTPGEIRHAGPPLDAHGDAIRADLADGQAVLRTPSTRTTAPDRLPVHERPARPEPTKESI